MTSTISIAATFSAEPIKAPMAFWGEELDLPLQIEFAPYRQIFQELLDVHSGFARNQRGLNVILLRFEDLVPGWTAGTPQTPAREHLDSLARNGHELATAIQAASLRFVVPSLVVICPASPSAQELPDLAAALHQAEIEFVTAAESLPHVEVITPDQLLMHHAVAEYYDAAADRLGNIPYTPLFFTTLGTQIVRRLHARCRPPFKLLVLDCDQTLWNGVCGEDGPERVSLDESRRYLQHFVQAQRQAGMLLALSSKNNPADVAEVFRLHPEFPLRESDFAASQIHWEPKSQSIADLANELQLGLGSVVFLDDNPVECAEVAANCPEALVLPLPAKSADIPAFLRGIWAFDRPKATAEDRLRASFVQQDVHRDQLRQQTTTLTEFIATLNLVVQIENPALAELDRISQLTLRTNQFNTTTIRRDAAEIRRLFAEKTREFVVVRVSDRFGDYGLVGAVVFETLTTSL
ncbi:MAG: HAD-IIIC family phosphatase, partial [Planctomycetes bacterium]|nr:HAD-IIIC family phosphatase [Planctomycetota bacterium]